MNTDNEMAHNAILMKRCKKTYNIIVTIYAGVCLFYAGITLFLMLLGRTNNVFISFLDGVIFKSALLSCGFLACYKHDTKFILFAMITALINLFVSDNINGIIFMMSIILSVATAFINKEYHRLENQLGFPYFNERFEEQNFDRRQREIKDEFQQNYERIIKNSSSDMIDITSSAHTIDLTKKSDSEQKRVMDDI